MEFNIKLKADELNLVLEHLGAGQLNRVRPTFDNILGQAQRQEVEANTPPAPAEVEPQVN
jgi:hypothetical protein